MTETIPRRRPVNVWLQTTVAVLSGAAAMYCLQNLRGAPSAPPPLPAAAPGLGPAEKPGPVEEKAVTTPPPRLKGSKALPEKAMLVKPEPGGAPEGMVRAFYDDGVQVKGVSPYREMEAEKLPPRLVAKATVVGHGFSRLDFKPMTFARKTPPPKAKAPVPVKFYPQMLDKKPLTDKDLVRPSPLHPEDLPEKPFWTEERIFKVVASGLFAIVGFGYCLKASGLLDPREPEEKA